jgi:hypothetical protein
VDLSVAPQLTEALEATIRESVGAFVIDLGDVTFLDSSGVNVILRARATLGRDERALPSSARRDRRGASSKWPASPTCSSSSTRASTPRPRYNRPADRGSPPAALCVRAGPRQHAQRRAPHPLR